MVIGPAYEELRMGVFVCDCGLNIAGAVDCAAVAEHAATLPDVRCVVRNKYTCADPGQNEIKNAVREHRLNRVVVASCTPRQHEPTFRKCVLDAGLNPYLPGGALRPRPVGVDGSRDWRGEHSGHARRPCARCWRAPWRTRRVRPLVSVAAAAGIILLESWVRRGDPFVSGYEGNRGAETVLPYSGLPGFSYPFFFGVLSILLSFGKGLVFYAPGLLLWTRETAARVTDRLRATQGLWLWFVAGLVLVYARWWAWYGGWTWGPRYFLIASLPASLALAVRLRRPAEASLGSLTATAAALTLSAWVGVNGAAFEQRTLAVCHDNHYALEFLCWYVPEFSALWRPFVVPSAPLVTQGAYGIQLNCSERH